MKLSAAFNHSFSNGYSYLSDVYNVAKLIPNLNGLYLCDSEYLKLSKIGINSSFQVETIYNLLFDGNFLKAEGVPTLVLNDSQFNGKPSINFSNNGDQKLLFRFPVKVGTLIIVYLTRLANSYLVFAPREISGNPPIKFDAFPSGGNSLWSRQPLANDSVYNALSRINGKQVSPDAFLPLNNPRILSVTNINNSNQYEVVNGFGGSEVVGSSSVRGKIAAIITAESPCPINILSAVEAKLAEIYIDYKGVVISSNPAFRLFVGEYFSFDFSTIAVDEFFDITTYNYVSPPNLGLSFSGSVLSGYINEVFKGLFYISIENSNSMVSNFSFQIETVKADPFVLNFPKQSNIKVSLSTLKDEDDIPYGIYTDEFSNLVTWEDSRRLPNKPFYAVNNSDLDINQIIYDGSKVTFITNISNNSKSLSGVNVLCKTLIWVYKQKQSGQRFMGINFPDIFANGVLWTTSTPEEVFGTTPITQLSTRVNKVSVNTFNYKLPLDYLSIISAKSQTSSIPFSGFTSQLKGELLYFIGWDITLTEEEIFQSISLLGNKFFNSKLTVFSTETEYRYTSQVIVNLDKKVLDVGGNTVNYEILENNYSAVIVGNDLIFTCNTDDFVKFKIRAYTEQESVTFDFFVSITLLTNQLYINLKNKLNTFSSFFIVIPETVLILNGNILQLNEYRLNGEQLAGINSVKYKSLPQIDDNPSASFNIDGSSYLSGISSSGYCFVSAYIRKSGQSGAAFLFGQENNNIFNSGEDGEILSSDFFGDVWANGEFKSNSYVIPEECLSIVIFNCENLTTINSIAKDRVFNDRSVKGSIPLFFIVDYKISPSYFPEIEKMIRDYYQPSRVITLINFDDNLTESSFRSKLMTTNNPNLDTANKKFGSSSFSITKNGTPFYIQIPNDSDYAYLKEDFTIAGWFLCDRQTINSEVINIYSQQGLCLYISSDKIYLGRSLIVGLSLFSIPFNYSSFDFNHFAISRQNGILRFFLNGLKVFQFNDDYEYRDWNSPAQIGQSSQINTPSININIDSFIIYRRISIYNNESFILPTSPYSI